MLPAREVTQTWQIEGAYVSTPYARFCHMFTLSQQGGVPIYSVISKDLATKNSNWRIFVCIIRIFRLLFPRKIGLKN